MARIGIDATAVAPNGKGVSRYEKNLIQTLCELDSRHEYYVFLNGAVGKSWFSERPNVHWVRIPIWKKFFCEQFQFPYYAKKLKLDLIQQTSYRLSFLSSVPTVLCIFEAPYFRSQWANKWQKQKSWYAKISDRLTLSFFPKSLRIAKRILVGSQNTKNSLMKSFNIASNKIRVVYLGCEESFKPLSQSRTRSTAMNEFGISGKYILHFATGDFRENTELVLKAFQGVRKRLDNGIQLVLAGAGAYCLERDLAHDVVKLPFLAEEKLIALYQGASLYVDPSFYEGFGFQILEAMACGIPVIASNATSIPEILGSAGLLIDPTDSNALEEGMIRVLRDQNLWNQMRDQGIEQAKRFNWQKAALETLSVYEEILGLEAPKPLR